MKIPHFIEADAIKLEAPAIAELLNEAIVTVAMGGLIEAEKLPASLVSHYDAQTAATWLQGVSETLVGVILDRMGFGDAKGAVIEAMRKNPATIPVEKPAQ